MMSEDWDTKLSVDNAYPLDPFLTVVGIPPTSVVITGTPYELASPKTMGVQSAWVGRIRK